MDVQGGGALERKEALFIIVACVGGMGAAFRDTVDDKE